MTRSSKKNGFERNGTYSAATSAAQPATGKSQAPFLKAKKRAPARAPFEFMRRSVAAAGAGQVFRVDARAVGARTAAPAEQADAHRRRARHGGCTRKRGERNERGVDRRADV